jgi:hypothetical protein
MSKELMIDFETMSTKPNAVVLTMGCVHFNPWGNGYGDSLYLRINVDQQMEMGRDVDPETLDWWGKQNPEVMEEAFNPDDRVSLEDAMDQFHKFAWGCSRFWSHGATFDLMIIENIYAQLKKPLPWNFWQLRCSRTLMDLGLDPDMPKNSKHNALQDAIRQSVGVQNIFNKLNIRQK